MNCPHCHQPLPDPDAITVTPETVVDSYEIWLARPSGRNAVRLTARIPIICVETERTAPPKEPLTEPMAEQPA